MSVAKSLLVVAAATVGVLLIGVAPAWANHVVSWGFGDSAGPRETIAEGGEPVDVVVEVSLNGAPLPNHAMAANVYQDRVEPGAELEVIDFATNGRGIARFVVDGVPPDEFWVVQLCDADGCLYGTAGIAGAPAPEPEPVAPAPPASPEPPADAGGGATLWVVLIILALLLLFGGAFLTFGSPSAGGKPPPAPPKGPPTTGSAPAPPVIVTRPPGVPSCRIEVQATKITALKGLPVYHLCVVYFDQNGVATYFRGGPGGPGGEPPYGTIEAITGAHVPGSIDYQAGCPTVVVAKGPKVCGANVLLAAECARVNKLGVRYNKFGPNSNTTARRLLKAAGARQDKPVWSAPGWDDTALDPPPPDTTGIAPVTGGTVP